MLMLKYHEKILVLMNHQCYTITKYSPKTHILLQFGTLVGRLQCVLLTPAFVNWMVIFFPFYQIH